MATVGGEPVGKDATGGASANIDVVSREQVMVWRAAKRR
jgi:hypothetical protein